MSERSTQSRAEQDARWAGPMSAAPSGDAECYAPLPGELETTLRRFLRRILGHADRVDECLQESLIAIHKARHTYDPRRPLRPWAFGLARSELVEPSGEQR